MLIQVDGRPMITPAAEPQNCSELNVGQGSKSRLPQLACF
jgi:hypothetical protein